MNNTKKNIIRPINNSKNKLNSKKIDFLSNFKCTRSSFKG